MRAMPASGSLRSTANDLLEFLAYNLGQKKSPLDAAMRYQRVPMRVLGWGRTTLGGESVYGHAGGKEGYRSAVVFNPRTQTGVVVLANARTDDHPFDLAKHLLFAGSPLSAPSRAPSRPNIVRVPANTLAAHVGQYRLDSGQICEVARKHDHLLIDMTGDGVLKLLPSSAREFFSNGDDVRIVFEIDANSATSGFTLHEGDKQQHAARINAHL
jgi:hypothetical protein